MTIFRVFNTENADVRLTNRQASGGIATNFVQSVPKTYPINGMVLSTDKRQCNSFKFQFDE